MKDFFKKQLSFLRKTEEIAEAQKYYARLTLKFWHLSIESERERMAML